MKSVLVIGMGRFGYHLACKMKALGNDVMIVDRNADRINEIAEQVFNQLIGDDGAKIQSKPIVFESLYE